MTNEVARIFGTMAGISFCGVQYELPLLTKEEFTQIKKLVEQYMFNIKDEEFLGTINEIQFENCTKAYNLMKKSLTKYESDACYLD